MTLPTPQQIVIAEHVLVREIADEAVLLDLQNGRYFSLNEVGTRTWQLLSECHGKTDQILAQLQTEYEVSQETLHTDFANLIVQLQQVGLITTT